MLQQTAQPAIRTREEKSVATKENFVLTEIVKEQKKILSQQSRQAEEKNACHDKENYVATVSRGRSV